MRSTGGKRFVIGVEGLTALVTGASALVVLVAFLVLWLVVSDARTTLRAASFARAEYISQALAPRPSQDLLETIVGSSVPGGGVSSVVVEVDDGKTFAYPTVDETDVESSEAVTVKSMDGYSVTLLTYEPSVLGESTVILFLFGFFAVLLVVSAVMVPSFLRKNVLEPLRGILGEADRFESGSGSTPMAATASFRKLIDLLKERDMQLEEMKAAALKRAELAESRSGAILNALGSAVVVVDSSGHASLWNSQAAELFGTGDEGNACLEKSIEPCKKEKKTEWDEEKNGKILRYKVTPGEEGERIVLVTDVTSTVVLERRLAEESALADLGALSGGVAHEIGNVLCALEGFLDLLAHGAKSERTKNILGEAVIELQSAKKIVESFRNLAQQSSIESSVSVESASDTIEEVCKGKAVSFTRQKDSSEAVSAQIPGSEVLLSRILENLLSNALRVSSESSVEVSVTDSVSDRVFIFTVADRGPGLPDPADLVFRPMYTTAEELGGMGLGLTITKRIVNAMGGTIKAENRAGGGALFTVIIPHMEGEP